MTPALVRVAVPDGVPADVVADALWAHGPAGVLEGDGWLEAGFASMDAAERVVGSLRWPATVVEVTDTTWQDAWKAHAGVVEVGPIVLVPAWRPTVVLDPGTSFGSGSHPSTRLCIAALTEVVTPGATVLDIGCGSGVLSIVAMKLGAAACVAIDVATEAIEATRENASRNAVDVDVRHELVDDVDGAYDVVVANIGLAVLRAIAAEVSARVGEWLVLGGLLQDQVPEVVAAYAAQGLELVRVGLEDGWATPVLRT